MADQMLRIAGRGDDGLAKAIKTDSNGNVGTITVSSAVKSAVHTGTILANSTIDLIGTDKECIIHEITVMYTNDDYGRESFRLYFTPNFIDARYTPLTSTNGYVAFITPTSAMYSGLFQTVANDLEARVVTLRNPITLKGFSIQLFNQSALPVDMSFYITYSEVK